MNINHKEAVLLVGLTFYSAQGVEGMKRTSRSPHSEWKVKESRVQRKGAMDYYSVLTLNSSFFFLLYLYVK